MSDLNSSSARVGVTIDSAAQDAVCARVGVILEALGLTHREFADRVGMTKGTMSKSMLNRRRFNLDDVVAIADVFDVSVDWLLGRVDGPVPGANTSDTDTDIDTDAEAVDTDADADAGDLVDVETP